MQPRVLVGLLPAGLKVCAFVRKMEAIKDQFPDIMRLGLMDEIRNGWEDDECWSFRTPEESFSRYDVAERIIYEGAMSVRDYLDEAAFAEGIILEGPELEDFIKLVADQITAALRKTGWPV